MEELWEVYITINILTHLVITLYDSFAHALEQLFEFLGRSHNSTLDQIQFWSESVL